MPPMPLPPVPKPVITIAIRAMPRMASKTPLRSFLRNVEVIGSRSSIEKGRARRRGSALGRRP
jgi:hypothetical protein